MKKVIVYAAASALLIARGVEVVRVADEHIQAMLTLVKAGVDKGTAVKAVSPFYPNNKDYLEAAYDLAVESMPAVAAPEAPMIASAIA